MSRSGLGYLRGLLRMFGPPGPPRGGAPWDDALRWCAALRDATADFTVYTFMRLARRYRFHLDKLPVGPEPIHDLEAVGGYPEDLLAYVRAIGRRTLNSSCYFGPRTFLDSLADEGYFGCLTDNLGVSRDDIRILGGDHGDGRWMLLVRTGAIFFMEVDDDYFGQVPGPCFANFTNWFRANFILGLLECELERRGIDVYERVPAEFSRGLLTELAEIDSCLTPQTWPYDLLYRCDV